VPLSPWPFVRAIGDPAAAQLAAARAAWPQALPMPSDEELRALVYAINRAARA